MFRFVWVTGALALIAATLVGAAPANGPTFPARIDLPNGFRPEGIAIRRHTFYVGSISTGAVYSGDLRTGQGAILVPGVTGRSSIGVFASRRDRLFVAGGATGKGFVYDAKTGALIAEPTLTTKTPRFINDVFATRDAVFFTNTSQPELYRIAIGQNGALSSAVQTITAPTGLNGIEATPNGKTLIAVQPSTGKLFRIDATTFASTEIVLDVPVVNGDGLVLQGKTLYVVENRDNRVAVVELSSGRTSGKVQSYLTGDLDIPSTADGFRKFLYVVNARFGVASPDTAAYWITQLERPKKAGKKDDDDKGKEKKGDRGKGKAKGKGKDD